MRNRLNPIDRLIQVLEGQRTVYAALLLLYRQYHQAMTNWDLVALKPLLLEEQRLAKELSLLEQRRLSAMLHFARERQIDAKLPLTQQQVLAYLEQEQGMQERQRLLQRLGEEIVQSMRNLEILREPLLPLLQSALAFLARHKKTVINPGATPYGAAGKKRPVQERNALFDKKV